MAKQVGVCCFFGLLVISAFFTTTQARQTCYTDDLLEYTCSDDQTCCDYMSCCTYTWTIWGLWYFWLLLFLFISIVSSCIACCVRAARRRQIQRYYTVPAQQTVYGTVVVTQDSTSYPPAVPSAQLPPYSGVNTKPGQGYYPPPPAYQQ